MSQQSPPAQLVTAIDQLNRLIDAYHQLPYKEPRYPSVSDRAEVETVYEVVKALACQLGLKFPKLELAGLPAYKAHFLQHSPSGYVPVHDSFFAVSNLTRWQHEINILRSAAERLAERQSGDEPGECQYVTLDQIAVFLKCHKRTVTREMEKRDSNPPPPDREGGGGKAHLWRWDRIRPWLLLRFPRQIPERFPEFR
jgi:hypothetical protein